MKILHRYIVVFVVLTLLFSCKGVDEISFTGIENVRLTGMDNNIVNFSADVGIHNPSSASFRIREVNLKASVDGNFIGTLSTVNPLKIKAKSDSLYHADFSLTLANLVTGATSLYSAMNKKQVIIEMQGYVTARSWLAFKKVEVSEKQLIDVPKLR